MQEMKAQGKSFGVESNPLRESGQTPDYSFPVERKEFLFVTSPFGMREDTQERGKLMHTGIDIRCNGDDVLATEKEERSLRPTAGRSRWNTDGKTAAKYSVSTRTSAKFPSRPVIRYRPGSVSARRERPISRRPGNTCISG